MADPISQSEAKECLAALLEVEEGMTPWEVGFVEDMSNWKGDFRPDQKKKIVEIYDKVC